MYGTILDSALTGHRGDPRRGKYKTAHTSAGELPYVDTGGDKDVLLMVPDSPCVIEHHLELIEVLRADFRVICFELPGNGGAFPRADFTFTVSETADAVIEFMNALSIDRAILNFSCVNALHAMNLSIRYPERVIYLALVQVPSISAMIDWTSTNIPKPLRVPFLGQIFGRLTARMLADKWFSVALPRPSEHLENFTQLSRESLNSGGCFCLASVVQGALRSPHEDMLGVDRPTLMCFGDKDYSHRHTNFDSLTDSIPMAQTMKLTGCGHFPQLERPEAFATLLRELDWS